MLFFAAFLIGAAAPAVAKAPDNVKARNDQSWEVLFSQYPPRALAAGEQGQVGYKVKLDREGWATECAVTKSSGHPLLDDETCRLILNRATFKGVTDSHGRRVATVTEGTVDWRLPTQTAAGAPAPSGLRIVDAPMPASEKRICKRTLKTGTLATYERQCLTEAQWHRQRESQRDAWGDLQGTKGSTSGK
ncbi:MAG: energy transducer TonB [Allosphingosinicella sp.]